MKAKLGLALVITLLALAGTTMAWKEGTTTTIHFTTIPTTTLHTTTISTTTISSTTIPSTTTIESCVECTSVATTTIFESASTTSTTITILTTTTSNYNPSGYKSSGSVGGIPDFFGECMFNGLFNPKIKVVAYWNISSGSIWIIDCTTGISRNILMHLI